MRIDDTLALCGCGEPLNPDTGDCDLCREGYEGEVIYERWLVDERVRGADARAVLATAGEPWWAQ